MTASMIDAPSSIMNHGTSGIGRFIDDLDDPGFGTDVKIIRSFSFTKPSAASSRHEDASETHASDSTTSFISPSSSMASLVQPSTAQAESDQEHPGQQQREPSESEARNHQSCDHHQDQQQRRYEELRILDGPLYAPQAPSRNSSRDCLLDYTKTITANSSFSNDIQGAAATIDDVIDLSNHFLQHRPSPMTAETTALLIVDVQPEYWSNCPVVRKDFPDFPKHLHDTIEVCRRRRAKIIWVRADYRYSHSPWLSQFERIRGKDNVGEVPCDPDSPEFTWEDFAKPVGGEIIIAKSSWSSTSNTALMDILRVAGIDTVLVCGLITSVCVQHSAFGIFEAGYRTLLVTDACADRGRARHEAALALYGNYMYELVTSEDLESEESGLIPAKPVWLMLDDKTKTVRANHFPKQRLYSSPSPSPPSLLP